MKNILTLITTLLLFGCGGKDDQVGVHPTPTPEPEIYALQVSWDIPTTREDGSEMLLSEIGGYRVVYTNPYNEVQEYILESPTQTKLILQDVEKGLHTATISCYDVDGLFSEETELVKTTIGD